MNRLSLAALGSKSTALEVDPRHLTTGIVHLGIGAFHRGHQAAYTQDAILHTKDRRWGICGVSMRSDTVVDQLAPQDGLYTLTERGVGARQPRVVGTVCEVIPGHRRPGAVVARIGDPDVHVVTLTVTEKGYRIDPATRGIAVADPAVRADLDGEPPTTAVGMLVAGIERRRRVGAGGLTVISCDNLPRNGDVLARLVWDFVDRLPDERRGPLSEYVARQVRFPSSMVDRITPATTAADRDEAAAWLGLEDEGAVVAEPFAQWVLEDDAAGPLPGWAGVGVTLVRDVGPWEACKLRLLNASHTMLALLGLLDGHATIAEAVSVPSLREAARRLQLDDVRPTLQVPAGLDVASYGAQVLDRFANPALRHTTAQVSNDTSQKIGPRVLETVVDALRLGHTPTWAALVVAAWLRRIETATEAELADPLAASLKAAVAEAPTVTAMLEGLWRLDLLPAAVLGSTDFVAAVANHHRALVERPASLAVEGILHV